MHIREALLVSIGVVAAAACASPVTSDAAGTDAHADTMLDALVDGRDAPSPLDTPPGDVESDASVTDAPTSADTTDVPAGDAGGSAYDPVVLADHPVGYWTLAHAPSGTEPDASGHGHSGSYRGGTPMNATLPNGDIGADFDGASQYLNIATDASFSIPTTHAFTWEAWIRPDVLQFPNSGSGGYVDWMGKCEEYSPSCEWEARMYNLTNPQMRTSRFSAYVFNPTAGLGSGADWQPDPGVINAGEWHHIVAEYQTTMQPSVCTGPEVGGLDIFVDGVRWNMASHGQTGCFSQYHVTPVAGPSAVNIGTMARDTWFAGAIAKVAFYDVLLTPAQIATHFTAMTGRAPTGSCAATCSL